MAVTTGVSNSFSRRKGLSDAKEEETIEAQKSPRLKALDEWCGCNLGCNRRDLLSQDEDPTAVDIFSRHLNNCPTPGRCPNHTKVCACFYHPDDCIPLLMDDPIAFGESSSPRSSYLRDRRSTPLDCSTNYCVGGFVRGIHPAVTCFDQCA